MRVARSRIPPATQARVRCCCVVTWNAHYATVHGTASPCFNVLDYESRSAGRGGEGDQRQNAVFIMTKLFVFVLMIANHLISRDLLDHPDLLDPL